MKNPTQDKTPTAQSTATRILDAARNVLFNEGVGALTMDSLASSLGISKKTLYVHFPSKDAIQCAIIEAFARHMHDQLEAIVSNKRLSSPEKLCAVIQHVGKATARLTPGFLREVQRNAPAVYERIDQIRRRNIPLFFGRMLRDGIAEGSIRADIDPDFACEFWLQAMRGMMAPDVLDRYGMTPPQILEKSIELFFNGLLTHSGREQYRHHLQSCGKHRNA